MRPTLLDFRSPKERTPAFYSSYVSLSLNTHLRQLAMEANCLALSSKGEMFTTNGWSSNKKMVEILEGLLY